MKVRIEHDSLGEIQVPADRYWGAVTQRSYQNFEIGSEKMPRDVICAIALVKKAAAIANHTLGVLDQERSELIQQVCNEILAGDLENHFPLIVWQTGSGTQTNMNVNEVIANRGNEIAGKKLLHPNDHVNKSQSSNDVFPTAMHLSAMVKIHSQLLPVLDHIINTLTKMEEKYRNVVKNGRTHLQDATPVTFGQEVSGWLASIQQSKRMVELSLQPLYEIALGGTAVGTGLNTPEGYAEKVAQVLAQITELPIKTSSNKFHSLSSKDELVFTHGALATLASDMMKIANDVRWLASGPRSGIGEITLPTNEPGSSIMPGKVNPTQCEALSMVAIQVMANDNLMSMANSQGNFELNVYMPVMIYNFIQSVQLLADAIASFDHKCLVGIEVNERRMKELVDQSLMLVTKLNTHIGYEKAAEIAKKAFNDDSTLKEACLALGYLEAEEFDRLVDPSTMV
ncbi:class II fumarate hydratase [Facklamia miroungae]|uniref:Fumarate hydratase class II n=1 Tax=Facklamia miroungae TaxID=120956 RepID=A0A1G7T5Z9_9LACT|nr:class II fumarate hydratase [Facklamia miroungae]NKZ29678.1 class II fumarate hydratase [Facklamia miroungae]SDG30743.1 fumarate hydratase, class II [Facklamia miroungae]